MNEDSFWDNQDSSSDTVDSSSTSSDDFWGSQAESSSQSADDFWSNQESSSQSADDFWNNQGGSSQSQNNTQQQQQTQPVEPPKPPIETKFGYKGVALIAVGICVLFALFLTLINSIKISKKTDNIDTVTTQSQANNTTVVSTSDVNFTTIPASMSLDYSGQVFDGVGTVSSKNRYLVNNQVIYNLQIDMGSQRVEFYCNYDTYASVNTGDTLKVSYQIPQSGYISVTQINYSN